MAWSAKLVTVFNEGCAPRFKVDDDAFTKRMLVMPHRAFFCKDEAARVAHRGEPSTYDADGTKIEALEAEPWKLLAWFLTGLERYWASGYVEFQAPPACREWAGALVEEQDPLRHWVEETILSGVPDDFIWHTDILTVYKQAHGAAGLGPRQLKKRLETVLPNAVWKREHCADGQQKAAWVGIRFSSR